jgi:hypothetical protein
MAVTLVSSCGDHEDSRQPAGAARGAQPMAAPSYGVVSARDDTVCLRSALDARTIAGPILVLLPDRQGALYARVGQELQVCPSELGQPGARLFSLAAPAFEAGDLGIAVLADSAAVGDGARTDLDRDGVAEHYRTCASTEGVHLTVWAGEPLTGRRTWHAYYYLGYDVEPNCTAAETGKD